MGAWQHHIHIESKLLDQFLSQAPQTLSGHSDSLEHLFIESQTVDQLHIPGLARRIDQLGRGGFRILVHLLTGQKKVEIIRNEQKGFRLLHIFRLLLLYRHQLKDGIEHHLLDSRPLIQFHFRDPAVYFLIHAIRPAVPVAYHVPDHLVILIQQDIVHAPGVDSHARRELPDLFTLLYSIFNVFEQPFIIPAKAAVLFGHSIFKPIDLFQYDLSILYAS